MFRMARGPLKILVCVCRFRVEVGLQVSLFQAHHDIKKRNRLQRLVSSELDVGMLGITGLDEVV